MNEFVQKMNVYIENEIIPGDHAFEDIEVKINAPELLEQALRKKRKKCMIGTGAMSDPYLHLERELQAGEQLSLFDR